MGLLSTTGVGCERLPRAYPCADPTLYRVQHSYSGVRGCSRLRKVWSCIFGRFSSKNYYGKPYSNRNFGVFGCRIFKNQKICGEKIEKIKIASNNFKQCPWATQLPNMRSQLPLGPKIIAGEIWSRIVWGVTGVLDHFQWDLHWKWLRSGRDSQIFDFKSRQL